MGQSVQSGVTTVSGSVTASGATIPSTATIVVRSNSCNAAGNTTLYTVTAGKTLYIINAWSNTRSSTAIGGTVRVDADVLGDGTYRTLSCVNYASAATGQSFPAMSNSFNPAITVPATKLVRLTADGTGNGEGGFIGYEM